MVLTDRPRERLLQYGPASLSDAELLAIVLRSGNRSISALGLASMLLGVFGNLKALLYADIYQLLSLPGIGLAKATSIKAVCELSLRLRLICEKPCQDIQKPVDVFELVRKGFYSKKREHLLLLSLDSKHRLISKDIISIGILTETLVHPREVFTQAILKSAAAIILVHNHPSGDPTPSVQDITLTKRIAQAGITLGIPLIDHIVVCDDSFVSMKSDNVFTSPREEVIT